MRRRLGVAAGVAAGVAFCAAVLAVLSGPDDVVGLPPRTLRSDGVAVVTNPNLVSRVGPVVHLSAERTGGPSDVDLLLALGRTEDVRSYVGAAPHDVVVQVLPEVGTIRTRELDGTGRLPGPPAGQDFWVLERAGRDAVSVRWPTADGVWSWALLNADGSAGVAAKVSLGVEVPGLFGWSLAVLIADLLAVAGAVAAPRVLAARRASAAGRRPVRTGRRAVVPVAPTGVVPPLADPPSSHPDPPTDPLPEAFRLSAAPSDPFGPADGAHRR